MKPYIVHRAEPGKANRVTHRATGRFLGRLGQHYGGGGLDDWWTAWSPFFEDGLGEVCGTRGEAADMLLDSYYHEPPVGRRMCRPCRNTLPHPPGPCDACESNEEALARSRVEMADAWAHYDWLREMAEKWVWPLRDSHPVFPDAICGFGAIRRHDVHAGVDLFCELGTEVVAVEDGVVVGIELFTGPNVVDPRPSPWWNETFAVLVESQTGVVAYGECTPRVQVGDRVKAGQALAVIDTAVLKAFRGRPMVMLHLELWAPGVTHTATWGSDPTPPEERERPAKLLDPTMPILEAAGEGFEVFRISRYDGKRFRDPAAEALASRWWAVWGGESPSGRTS